MKPHFENEEFDESDNNELEDDSDDFSPPENEVEKQLKIGQNWLAMGQIDRAIEAFRAALTLDAEHPFAHAQMALALVGAKRFEAARGEAQIALMMLPDLAFFHFVAGAVEFAAGSYKAAKTHLQNAIELDPEDADSHALLSATWLQLEKYREAEDAAREALLLEPENGEAHLFLGLALLEQKQKIEARPHFERALELSPGDEGAHHGAAVFYLKSGDIERAQTHIREALRLDPDDENSKQTFVQILGAKNWFYGAFWKWSLALSHLPQWGRLAVIFGLWAMMQALRAFGKTHPEWKPVIGAIALVYLVFCLYTWVAPGLFNWYLRRANRI